MRHAQTLGAQTLAPGSDSCIPALYEGLPDNPRISPLVGLWKGVMKPISLAAIAFAGVFGFLHYITKGPNEVSESDERKADDIMKGQPPKGTGA